MLDDQGIAAGAAFVFAITTASVIAFQVALALGASWGAYAMGGAFPGTYPPLMRLSALAQAALLVLMALVVLSRAGLISQQWRDASRWLVWVVVVFSAVAISLNLVTPSAGERRIWAPVSVVLLVCSLTVALAAR